MDIGAGEYECAKFTAAVNAGMELEAVVLTLPVVAGVGNALSNPVPATTHQPAHFEHGTVHEAKLRFAL